MRPIINVYCDESCHLQASESHVMAWGAVYCRKERTREFAIKIRNIKEKHGLGKKFEIKWTKVSSAKMAFYKELIDFFFLESALFFRGLLAPDKSKLNHDRFHQTHNDFYYKMYYVLLDWIIQSTNTYHFYLDIKDTRGGEKTRDLHKFLAYKNYDYDFECINKVQQIRSHESEILQLTDLFTGALCYKARKLETSCAKMELISHIESRLPSHNLTKRSAYQYRKFNVFPWEAR